MRRDIAFLRRGRPVRLDNPSPTLTLLDYLRLQERATGTKEGCAEGDCGACTVVLRRLSGEGLVYQPVNACILLAGQADGAEIITVEDLADGATLHPVQQAMVDKHGSQCGFCTPGFIMALFALYHAPRRARLDRDVVNDFIAGNLCRCTGYRPITEAGLAACGDGRTDRFTDQEGEIRAALMALNDGGDLLVGTDQRFFAAPTSIASLASLYQAHPDAVLVGGATDVGLWITKQMRDLPKIIWLGRVQGLDTIEDAGDAVIFGAMASHETALPYMAAIDADLGELMRRFASVQIRTSGTIGGNIANGSPIGDTPPALIALGSTLILQRGDTTRARALEDFFVAYGKQDRATGEFVRAVKVPKLQPNEHFRCYKISKRFDQDISAVMGAFKITLDGERIVSARIAYGGMAATPKRASGAEAALVGAGVRDADSWEATLLALEADFSPLTDQRAGADYRRKVARILLCKALMEIAGTPSRITRMLGVREEAHAAAS